ADLVIEAVVEKLDVKRKVFKELDEITRYHTILATNSSTIVNSKIADITSRPEKVLNMHFFFPPLVMDCVEIVKSDQTSETTAQTAMNFCEEIDRTGILLEKEIYGFIANRLLFALSNEALYLYENGYADYKDIDIITKKALSHPLGPVELMDLSGIDVGYYANMQLYEETGDPKDNYMIIKDSLSHALVLLKLMDLSRIELGYETNMQLKEETGNPKDKPTKAMEEMMKAGNIGRKALKGWYDYTKVDKQMGDFVS